MVSGYAAGAISAKSMYAKMVRCLPWRSLTICRKNIDVASYHFFIKFIYKIIQGSGSFSLLGRSMGNQIPNRVNSRIRDLKERAVISLDKLLYLKAYIFYNHDRS